MVPVELSAKETMSGARPLMGLAMKPATGTSAPAPVRVLVELAALSAVKTITLLKLSSVTGLKRTTMLADPNPGRLKGMPDTMLNPDASGLTRAAPLEMGIVPRLVTTKAASALAPTATAPKSRLTGETAN